MKLFKNQKGQIDPFPIVGVITAIAGGLMWLFLGPAAIILVIKWGWLVAIGVAVFGFMYIWMKIMRG